MRGNRRIQVASPIFNGNEEKYVNDCMETAWISSNGKYIKLFEEKFADFCNSKHALSCCNGTVALHLSLLAMDLKPDDEVIIPTLTYVATANAVVYCRAKPVLVDCEADTLNIDPKLLEKKINQKTRGIIVVHLYGHPVDMDPVMEIAQKYGLFVIEDAAEAHGAEYKGRKVGSIGHIATFSFFGNKIITTGEGGMIITNNDKLAEKMRILKGQGMDPKRRYWFVTIGYNYRMTNIEAAIGLAQLENIDWHLNKRREIMQWYNEALRNMTEYLTLPVEKEWAKHSFWMYTVLLKDTSKMSRDSLMQALEKDDIETRPVFYPMHVMPPYFEDNADYPVSDKVSRAGINLPTHALLTKDDIEYIADRLKYHCGGHSQ